MIGTITPQEAGDCLDRLRFTAAKMLARDIARSKKDGQELSIEAHMLRDAMEDYWNLQERLAIQFLERDGDDLGKSALDSIVKGHQPDA